MNPSTNEWSSEPPPRFSVHWAAIRECLVRSTVYVGGGRSPLAFGRGVIVGFDAVLRGE
jgi:hypothetical protein